MTPLRLSLLAVTLAAVLAACGSTSAGEEPEQVEADVTVISVDMAFDPGTASAPAGEPFTLALVNRDAMPHNVAIYTDSSRSVKLFEGDMVTNGTLVYDIPALDAGEYFFDCSLHPNMTGTLVVGD